MVSLVKGHDTFTFDWTTAQSTTRWRTIVSKPHTRMFCLV